jgi:hypothetical protein
LHLLLLLPLPLLLHGPCWLPLLLPLLCKPRLQPLLLPLLLLLQQLPQSPLPLHVQLMQL